MVNSPSGQRRLIVCQKPKMNYPNEPPEPTCANPRSEHSLTRDTQWVGGYTQEQSFAPCVCADESSNCQTCNPSCQIGTGFDSRFQATGVNCGHPACRRTPPEPKSPVSTAVGGREALTSARSGVPKTLNMTKRNPGPTYAHGRIRPDAKPPKGTK